MLIVMMSFQQEGKVSIISELFPFTKYFSTAPQPVFKGWSYLEDMDIAEVSERCPLVCTCVRAFMTSLVF